MSYFKSRTSESSNNNNNNNTKNEFTFNSNNLFASAVADKPVVYLHNDNQFPDLVDNNCIKKTISTNACNYMGAASTVIAKPVVKNEKVPDGLTQYTYYKATCRTIVSYGKKTKSELEREKQEQLENEPHYICDTILKELSYNWNKYRLAYDKTHGPNSYDNIYHTEPIYPYLDEEFNECDKDHYSN